MWLRTRCVGRSSGRCWEGPSSITFDIPGGGVQVIKLSQPLPAITQPVVIDGTSQPNYLNSPLIEIDGSGLAGSDNTGLDLVAGSSTIEGLSIVGFSGSGVVLSPTGNSSQVIGRLPRLFGRERAGPRQRHRNLDKRLIEQHVGATIAGAGNVISGNNDDGIQINAGGGIASDNDIYGNLIGTDPGGSLCRRKRAMRHRHGQCFRHRNRLRRGRFWQRNLGQRRRGYRSPLRHFGKPHPEQRNRSGPRWELRNRQWKRWHLLERLAR